MNNKYEFSQTELDKMIKEMDEQQGRGSFEKRPYHTVGVLYGLFLEALSFTLKEGEISSPMLQRRFNIPYNISANLLDLLELTDIITEDCNSSRRRKVIR